MFCVLIRLESPIQLCGHRLRETVLLMIMAGRLSK